MVRVNQTPSIFRYIYQREGVGTGWPQRADTQAASFSEGPPGIPATLSEWNTVRFPSVPQSGHVHSGNKAYRQNTRYTNKECSFSTSSCVEEHGPKMSDRLLSGRRDLSAGKVGDGDLRPCVENSVQLLDGAFWQSLVPRLLWNAGEMLPNDILLLLILTELLVWLWIVAGTAEPVTYLKWEEVLAEALS